MENSNSKIHIIPEDFHESKDGDQNTSYFDIIIQSKITQIQNDLSLQDSVPFNDHEERSDSLNEPLTGLAMEMLLGSLQKYSKLTCDLGATILENEAIQLHHRLISYRKQQQMKNHSSLQQYKDTSKTLDRQNNILMRDHHVTQSVHEKKESNGIRDEFKKLVPVQESSTSVDSVKVQLKAHPERSSSHHSGVSPFSAVLEKCNSKYDNGALNNYQSDEMFPDKLRKRSHSTASCSTRKGENENNDEDLEGDSVQSFTCDEGEYLCNRAKRMKKMAILLLQIENLHELFMMQVIDRTTNDDTST